MYARIKEASGGWTRYAVGDIIKVEEHPSNKNLYRLVSPTHYFNYVDDDIIWLNLPKSTCELVNKEDTIFKEIDWNTISLDTTLLELHDGQWRIIYFAVYRNNIPYVFENCCTSLTAEYIRKIFDLDNVVLYKGNESLLEDYGIYNVLIEKNEPEYTDENYGMNYKKIKLI